MRGESTQEGTALLVSVLYSEICKTGIMRPSAHVHTHTQLLGPPSLLRHHPPTREPQQTFPPIIQMYSRFIPRSLVSHLAGSDCAKLLNPFLHPLWGFTKPHHPKSVKIFSILQQNQKWHTVGESKTRRPNTKQCEHRILLQESKGL